MISTVVAHSNYHGFPFGQIVLYHLLGEDNAKRVVEDQIGAPIAIISQKPV